MRATTSLTFLTIATLLPRPTDDLLDARVLVTGHEQEPVAVLAHLLVLVERRADPLGARLVGALADEHRVVGVEPLCGLRDPLVDVAEQCLGMCHAHFSFSHDRLPLESTSDREIRLRLWPEPVERIASFLRASGATGRLEELPADADSAPGPAVLAAGFECDGRSSSRSSPRNAPWTATRSRRRRGAARCDRRNVPEFPFRGARVFVERTLLPAEAVWLEAGAEGFVLGLPPSDLARLTGAASADLLLEA